MGHTIVVAGSYEVTPPSVEGQGFGLQVIIRTWLVASQPVC